MMTPLISPEDATKLFSRMPSFWNCMRRRKWGAAHDVLVGYTRVHSDNVLPWRAKR